MGAEDQPGIGTAHVHADAHAARLAALLLRFPRMDNARAERAAGRVKPARHHGDPLRQAGLSGGFGRHLPDDRAARRDRRKQRGAQAQIAAERFVPGSARHIPACPAVALAGLLRHFARQTERDKAVRLQDFIRFLIDVGKLLPIPQHLGERVGRGKRVAAYGKQPLLPHRAAQFFADGRGPRIHPDRRRAENAPVPADGDRAPALAVHTDPGDLLRGKTALPRQTAQRRADGLPPVLRILLRPAGPGIGNGIGLRCLRQHAPRRIKRSSLAGRGADINSQQDCVHVRAHAFPSQPQTSMRLFTSSLTAARPALPYAFGSITDESASTLRTASV